MISCLLQPQRHGATKEFTGSLHPVRINFNETHFLRIKRQQSFKHDCKIHICSSVNYLELLYASKQKRLQFVHSSHNNEHELTQHGLFKHSQLFQLFRVSSKHDNLNLNTINLVLLNSKTTAKYLT